MSRSRLFQRLAAGSVATALATAGLTAAFITPAAAGTISNVTPPFAFNTGEAEIRFTTSSRFAGSTETTDSWYIDRQGPTHPSACQSPPLNVCPPETKRRTDDGSLQPDPVNRRYGIVVDLSFSNDYTTSNVPNASGPVPPGTYDMTYTGPSNNIGGPVPGTTGFETDTCQGCFTVLAAGPPTITNISHPNSRPSRTISPFTINGTNFNAATAVEALLGGVPDPTVRFFNQDTPTSGTARPDPNPDTAVQMTKELEVLPNAPGGVRDIRVTSTDGQSATCVGCFSVDSLFVDAVSPSAVSNSPAISGGIRRLAITGRPFQAGAVATLVRAPALVGQPDIVGTTVSITANLNGTQTIQADFDMNGAAPGANAYVVRVTNPDGTSGAWEGRFSVASAAPTLSGLEPNSQPTGTDDAPTVATGTNFARGATITFSNPGVTVAPGSLRYVSPTRYEFSVDVASNAPPGPADVTYKNADNQSATCTGCFTVTAAAEPSPSESPSESGSPSPSESPQPTPARDNGLFTAVVPSRIVDTRDGTGSVRSPLAGGETRSFQVHGRGDVPAGATAVAMNLTAISPTSSGFLTAFPSQTVRPNASNINFVRGDVIANLVVSKIGRDGRVSVYNNSGNTDIAADVVGYFAEPSGGGEPSASAEPSATASADPSATASADPSATASAEPSASPTSGGGGGGDAGRYTPVNPQRILDTRDGNGGSTRPIGPGESRQLQVTGRVGIPADATAVVFNMTAISPTASGFLTAFPTGATRPTASNINFRRGDVIANLVMVRLGAGGRVSIYNNSGDTHTAADVVGYYSPATSASSYTAVDPRRILDTRDGSNSPARPIGPGESRSFRVTNLGGVASNATAVVFNLTAISPTNSGFLTAYPAGTGRPVASNINFVRGDVIANLVVVRVGSGGQVSLFNNSGNTHAAADVVGYFGPFDPFATPTASPSETSSSTATPSATGSVDPSATESASASASPTGGGGGLPSLVPQRGGGPLEPDAGSGSVAPLGLFLLVGLVGAAGFTRRPAHARYARKH